jgi:hypothetical protein
MKHAWIDFGEQQPELETDVLVYTRSGDYRVASMFDNGAWMTPDMSRLLPGEVTHWQPLLPPDNSELAG